jgi:hypothetical protein
MKNFLILVAALGLITGCATKPPATATSYDPITGTRTDVSENLLQSEGTPREVVYLNMFREYRNARRNDFYLEAFYMAPSEAGYLEIPPGQTLTITADDDTLKFTGNGSMNRRRAYKKDFVRETALYEVDKGDLQKLANAKKIKIQLRGNNGLVEREFAPENFENLKAFVARAAN